MYPDNKDSSHGAQVKRKITTFTATIIVVANMIGTGIFVTSGTMAKWLPSSGLVIFCWIFGGLIAISGALCYSELATRMPEEGGEYVFLKKLYHPALGFLTGWTSFIVGFSAAIAAAGLSFSTYIFAGLDIQSPPIDPTLFLICKKTAAVSLILVFTLVHYLGIRLGSRVQNFFTIVKIFIVFGLAISGIVFASKNMSNISFEMGKSFGGMSIGTAMVLVMFSYSGWNASAYIAGELKQPRKTLPVSLVLGTVIVIIFYILINIFIFQAAPYSQLKGKEPVVEIASVSVFGNWMGNILGLLIAFVLISSLSAYILIGPRVYFAMARDRLFFSFASKVHPQYEVPGKSIILQGIIAVIFVIIASLQQLLIYLGLALWIFPWLAIFGLFIARRKRIGEEIAAKAWGYPFVPIFFLVSSLILIIVAFINKPIESTAAILTILFGVPCYFLWTWWTRGRQKK